MGRLPWSELDARLAALIGRDLGTDDVDRPLSHESRPLNQFWRDLMGRKMEWRPRAFRLL
jgi:hypothetical protein